MIESKMTRIIYALFVGVLISIFIGVGINTFYKAPEPPVYPEELSVYEEGGPNRTQVEKQTEYDALSDRHASDTQIYNRNVSIITLFAAVVLLAISIAYEKKIKVITDGVMMGGLFTLIYSLGRGLISGDDQYMFIAVSVGLVVVLYLGYKRLSPKSGSSKKRK